MSYFLNQELPETHAVPQGGVVDQEVLEIQASAWFGKENKLNMTSTPMLIKRLRKQEVAWTELAMGEEFAGMTLEDFRSIVTEVDDAVSNLDKCNALVSAGIKARREAEARARKMSKRLAMAIKSDPKHGEDSALLRASGFKPESEIRNGRKTASKPVVAPAALLQ